MADAGKMWGMSFCFSSLSELLILRNNCFIFNPLLQYLTLMKANILLLILWDLMGEFSSADLHITPLQTVPQIFISLLNAKG
ncbi:hypothetical protein BO83DRAFT_377674 [Aspergillus eucalypticola CBS 122712]|uniref:Uncharacterized protein n=1 Tax=Aspergillus eucalypticola (strain CBS 122712 / IBT 29274) TaxID=1448314 RepID=A0A317VJV5_ASPEC|nr:uncharacterized protein BO83DRAFT_377674 [Aspergillus eucalypticola CBS 122712]PWY74634.1 hypothetical protein BO83DRAFT_377674 [Aspergillus eucalypticola CBS 122712]